MTAQAGRLRVKIADRGWKDAGSSKVPAYMVKEASLPTIPPNTRLPQMGQELRTASPPLAALELNVRVAPLKRTAPLANPM